MPPAMPPQLWPMRSELTRERLLTLLERMWLIRAFEEKASELYARGMIGGLLHLGIGQEGVAAGSCVQLRRDDAVFGSHRAHAHAIAKGADVDKLMAELAGRATGYCGGKGGSMHISAMETGFITATGVVGGNIPLALGGALAARRAGTDRVSVVFFGDGTAQSGSFHESLNIAALWGLPVVLICENNGYAEFTPLSAHTNVARLAQHADTYGIPNVTVDGSDVVAVYDAVAAAVARARAGDGPSFVEALTHRLRGHYEGDPAKYRELSELEDWKQKDPLARYVGYLEQSGVISEDGAESPAAERAARQRVNGAAERALAAPFPDPSAVATQVYAG